MGNRDQPTGQTYPPESLLPNGTLYMWAEGFSPDDLQLADLPSWVVEATTTKRPANHKITNAGELDSGNRSPHAGHAFQPGWISDLQCAQLVIGLSAVSMFLTSCYYGGSKVFALLHYPVSGGSIA
jgi:hypothetical protein